MLQFWGAILWAYVTARLVDVIVNANPESTRFDGIDELNRFCAFSKLPKSMEIRLREYYMKRKQITQAESRQAVAEGLSPMLKGEVAWQINAHWLANIPFLNTDLKGVRSTGVLDPEMQKLRVRVALALRPNVYAPNEVPPIATSMSSSMALRDTAEARLSRVTIGASGRCSCIAHSSVGGEPRQSTTYTSSRLALRRSKASAQNPVPCRMIRRWVGWHALSEFLLDKLRRRRRLARLVLKRWTRRRPLIFMKMRCFMLTLFRMLKDVQHSRCEDAHFPHRNGLNTTVNDVVQDVPNDLVRLQVNLELQRLMAEQQQLVARIASDAPRLSSKPSKADVLLPGLNGGGPSTRPTGNQLHLLQDRCIKRFSYFIACGTVPRLRTSGLSTVDESSWQGQFSHTNSALEASGYLLYRGVCHIVTRPTGTWGGPRERCSPSALVCRSVGLGCGVCTRGVWASAVWAPMQYVRLLSKSMPSYKHNELDGDGDGLCAEVGREPPRADGASSGRRPHARRARATGRAAPRRDGYAAKLTHKLSRTRSTDICTITGLTARA